MNCPACIHKDKAIRTIDACLIDNTVIIGRLKDMPCLEYKKEVPSPKDTQK